MVGGQRMAAVDQLDQPCGVDVRVDLGGSDVGVSKQGLKHPEVGASSQQMGCKRMAEYVRADPVGRLTLNLLATFSEFEREMIVARTRDKVAAARRKGRWTGGVPVLGYDVDPRGGRILSAPVLEVP